MGIAATPIITSFIPLSGTSSSLVTTKGQYFTGVNSLYGITFRGKNSDSATILSDSLIEAWVGVGEGENVKVNNRYESLRLSIVQYAIYIIHK